MDNIKDVVATSQVLQTLGSRDESLPSSQLVSPGTGLSALPKKMVERILSREYIDFAELPPAKGKVRGIPSGLDGQVVLVQAADLLQSKKLIPDLATWIQCFALYVAVLAPSQPERVPELMAYMSFIARKSLRYAWPSWLVYDQNFRQEAAENPHLSWARADPGTYTESFSGQLIGRENWCSHCYSIDHYSFQCPLAAQSQSPGTSSAQYKLTQRPGPSLGGGGSGQFEDRPRKRSFNSRQEALGRAPRPCNLYNNNGGRCRYGRMCRYDHCCRACGGDHPINRCKTPNDPTPTSK